VRPRRKEPCDRALGVGILCRLQDRVMELTPKRHEKLEERNSQSQKKETKVGRKVVFRLVQERAKEGRLLKTAALTKKGGTCCPLPQVGTPPIKCLAPKHFTHHVACPVHHPWATTRRFVRKDQVVI
jgi:hypothetical protein